MKLLLTSLLGLAFASSAFAQGPNRDDVKIRDVIVNGSGCPTGTATVLATPSTPGGPVDYFQVTYDEFIAGTDRDNGQKQRVFCNIAIDLQFPQGWSYSILETETDVWAELVRGHWARASLQYQFRNVPGRGSVRTRQQRGPWSDQVQFKDKFGQVVWSPCNKTIPVNLKTTIQVGGRSRSGDHSEMGVDQQSGLFKTEWNFRWRRC